MEVLVKENIYNGENKNSFESVATKPGNPRYENAIKREKELYNSKTDIRSEFQRDHNRIIHSNAYKRLRHNGKGCRRIFLAWEKWFIFSR